MKKQENGQWGGEMERLPIESSAPKHIFKSSSRVSSACRQALFGHEALTIWMTGLSGAGKSTIAYALERRLIDDGFSAVALDGDNLRHGLNRDLGFSHQDRSENIRRLAEVAGLMNDAGLIVIVACISPLREDRERARGIVGETRFAEVYVSTSLAVCEQRDCKGLYAKARSGEIVQFTGISAPYEAPDHAALTVDTSLMALRESVDLLTRMTQHCCGLFNLAVERDHDFQI
ncbi:adenylyl-sulfate kinase [Chromobacterium sp. IIBBL 290-4]|uniref:adenylyl-sulfate kinase n=1 Tax=Chromobacterium sp. IIBBL 290-4 TaxID=2953890 RepID=UPI0020B710D4|nr:adenylyl-sulfate kinase [Chromobacterium sp. IIBBL 290-4]UTH73303.1 adenylyl-sulfate kinase [Chromobacterium sp. IIBBL 290-4]